MNFAEIASIRLNCQQLLGTKFSSPREIVEWMGAMQAQEFPMGKWAIGARLPGITDAEVERAVDQAEIIRTHLLRPTWHFVSPDDIYWLLELTAPQVKAAQSSRDRDLELTEEVYSKSNAILENALSNGKHLTRDELAAALNEAHIRTDQNRASHLFARAELEGIICSGATRNGKQTYALLSERVPQGRTLTRDEALFKLAGSYFHSRCPATLQDFAWWSGLPAKEARQALELIKPDFYSESVEERTYWIPDELSVDANVKATANLLPAYDEFTLSYAERSASIPEEIASYMKAISNRGVFRPIVVINGKVSGTWKREVNKDNMNVEVILFSEVDKPRKKLIEESAGKYGAYLQKSIEVRYSMEQVSN